MIERGIEFDVARQIQSGLYCKNMSGAGCRRDRTAPQLGNARRQRPAMERSPAHIEFGSVSLSGASVDQAAPDHSQGGKHFYHGGGRCDQSAVIVVKDGEVEGRLFPRLITVAGLIGLQTLGSQFLASGEA